MIDISCHQWMWAIACFDSLVWNPPVCHSVLKLLFWVAATCQAFPAERYLWHSDWLKLPSSWQPQTLCGLVIWLMWAITCFDSLVWNPPVFCSVARLQPVGQTWQPLFGIFQQNVICDIVIGWSCSVPGSPKPFVGWWDDSVIELWPKALIHPNGLWCKNWFMCWYVIIYILCVCVIWNNVIYEMISVWLSIRSMKLNMPFFFNTVDVISIDLWSFSCSDHYQSPWLCL